MVRVTLQYLNSTFAEQKLDFSTAGTLTQPIQKASTVSVIRFNIPNNIMPIMIWGNPSSSPPVDGNTLYWFALTYQGHSYTSYIQYQNLGGQDLPLWNGYKLIFNISNLVDMINTALTAAVTGLNGLIGLPTTVAPRVIFENNLFSFIVPASAYGLNVASANRIEIHMNNMCQYFFSSIPVEYDPILYFTLRFADTFENIYNTTFLKTTQTSISLGSFLSMRTLLITTSMPVDAEVISSSNSNSNQTGINILQSFDLNYNQGLTDILTNNEYASVSEPFRRVKINCDNLYDIRCQCSMVTSSGDVIPFLIQPQGYATITMEFL